MKIIKNITQLTLGIGLAASIHLAQGQPGGPGGGRMPVIPIMSALDTNTNGVIEASEITNASKALLKLDKNGDGKLSATELKPKPPANGNEPRGKPPVFPLMKALDANGDGELDADEIANASAALKTLDTNGDGKLSRNELMPTFPNRTVESTTTDRFDNPPDGFDGPPDGFDGPPDGFDGPPDGFDGPPDGFDGPPPDEE
jgi:Ca2+-binding EF-hand superfamily protein